LKRVLVTGATGFLGRHVVARLEARKWDVTIHGRASTSGEGLRGDLADPAVASALLAPWRWDSVINLAGPVTGGSEDLSTGIDVVASHTRIALHLRRFAGAARIVHASSMVVYGMPAQDAVDEDHPRHPQHLYGLAKLLAEDVLLVDETLDVWCLRLPGLFAASRESGALFHFCRAARTGDAIRVTTPTPTPWNVLHVEDAADALVAALEAPGRRGGAINVAHDEAIELVDVARRIAVLGGGRSCVEQLADVAHPPFRLATHKAATLLGWTPPSLDQRLRELYAGYAAT
jgi:NDP-hexose 4-ketoreductase